MDLQLADQPVVVIGAGGGIGRAVANQFLEAGSQVVWCDRDAGVSQIAAQYDRSAPTDGRVTVADATDLQAMSELADRVVRKFGQCSHVVVSVGVGSGKLGFPFWNLEPNDWQAVVDGNLMSVVNILHAFVPHMQREGCTFAILASVAGQIGSQTDPPYSAAKAAVINFAQCAAKDLAEFGTRVNVVCPGMVQTEINRQVWMAWRQSSPDHQLTYEEWAEDKIRRVAPLGRWQTADEIAAAVVFLASPLARNITGQTVNVDGGQVMHA